MAKSDLKRKLAAMSQDIAGFRLEESELLTDLEVLEVWEACTKGTNTQVKVDPRVLQTLVIGYARFLRRHASTLRAGMEERGGVPWSDALAEIEAKTGLGRNEARFWLVKYGVGALVTNGRSTRFKLHTDAVDAKTGIALVAAGGFFPGALSEKGLEVIIERMKAGKGMTVVRGKA